MSMTTMMLPTENDFSFENFELGLESFQKILAFAQEHSLSLESNTLLLRSYIAQNRFGLPDSVVYDSPVSMEDGTEKPNFIKRAIEWIKAQLKKLGDWLLGRKSADAKVDDAIADRTRKTGEKADAIREKLSEVASSNAVRIEIELRLPTYLWDRDTITLQQLAGLIDKFNHHIKDRLDHYDTVYKNAKAGRDEAAMKAALLISHPIHKEFFSRPIRVVRLKDAPLHDEMNNVIKSGSDALLTRAKQLSDKFRMFRDEVLEKADAAGKKALKELESAEFKEKLEYYQKWANDFGKMTTSGNFNPILNSLYFTCTEITGVYLFISPKVVGIHD